MQLTSPRYQKCYRQIVYLLILLCALIWISPLIFAFFTSFKSNVEVKKFVKLRNVLPINWVLDNYQFIFKNNAAPIVALTRNSFIVSLSQVVLVLFISSTSAYAYERLQFSGKEKIFWLLFGLSMIPPVIALVPQYMLYSAIGWSDQLISLITPYLGNVYNIFLLRNFLHEVPKELDEAARIDGANEWGIYSKIILPCISPAMTVVGLFTFTSAWNDMMWPSLAITTSNRLTLTAGIRLVNDSYGGYPERVLAACMLAAIPTLAVYLVAHKHIIKGLTLGSGVKG